MEKSAKHMMLFIYQSFIQLTRCGALYFLIIFVPPAFSQNHPLAQKTPVKVTSKHPLFSTPEKPTWEELTPMQQKALSPISAEWNSLSPIKKKKWLTIGNKFPSMKPEEKNRMQKRMREWHKLTPEQRHIARENYKRTKKISTSQKSKNWEQYQQLPEEQKKQFVTEIKRMS